jgi:hypothetical protein
MLCLHRSSGTCWNPRRGGSTGPIEPTPITKPGAVEEKNSAKVVWDRDGVQVERAIFGVGGVATD